MNKIKKIFISFGAFFTGLASKVFASGYAETKYGVFDPGLIEDKYGVFDPGMVETKYGVFQPEPTIGEKLLSVGKIALPIILFFIGLFVVLSKRITTKVKIIVVSILVAIAILGYVLINHIENNI